MLIHLISPISDEWAMCDWPGDENEGIDLTNVVNECTCGTCLAIFRAYQSMMDPDEVHIFWRHMENLDAVIEN